MDLLFNGPFDWFIICFGLVVGILHLLLLGSTQARSLGRNHFYRRKLGVVIQLFPLAGILGTVIGLIRTMAWIGEHGSRDIEGVVGQFATALSTTFWGIGFAFLLTLVNLLIEFRLGDEDAAAEPA
jgi:multisubunit Na+/H+ antiporter MnhE subunit